MERSEFDYEIDPMRVNPINVELIHVLVEASSSEESLNIPFRSLSAAPALVALVSQKVVKENTQVARNVVEALWELAKISAGLQACIDAGAPLALVSLSLEQAIEKSDLVISSVAEALMNISVSDAGCQACIDAGATSALSDLVREIKKNSWAIDNIIGALSSFAKSEDGRKLA